MGKLPKEVLEKFMKGEHVMRHQSGYWNAIWSDMFIETTFLRYGKGPGGIVGITLNGRSVKKWANGLHICTQIIRNVWSEARQKGNDISQRKCDPVLLQTVRVERKYETFLNNMSIH